MTFAGAKFAGLLPAATFSMVVEFLMGLSDSVIVGNIVGEDALSSVMLMQPAMNIVSFFAMLVGVGTSVLYSVEMGRFEQKRARELFTQGLWTALGFGALMIVGMSVLRRPVLSAFGASPAVFAGACDYWLWFMPCAVLEPVAMFFVQMCYNDGDGRLCTFSYAAQLVGNCALSIPLTIKFGLAGCAAGTTIGNAAAIAVLLAHFRRKGNTLGFVRHFSLGDTWRICLCSVGDAANRLCNAALFFLLPYYVIAHLGSEKLPVLAVVVTVLGLGEAFDGVATAAQPLATVYIGEGNPRLTRRIMGRATYAAVIEGAAMAVVLLAFPSLAVKMVGVTDPALADEAATAVRLVSLGLVGTSVTMLYNSYYMFVSRRAVAVVLTVAATFAAPFAMYMAMGALFGGAGVWLALGLAPYVALGAVALWLARMHGFDKVPLLLDRQRARKIRVYDLTLDERSICSVSEAVNKYLAARKAAGPALAARAALLVEEALMVIRDRNGGRRTLAEVTVDIADGVDIVMRDDGEIFNITDADQQISSLRSYLVSNLMVETPRRRNMTTTGFNRNHFSLR